MRIENFDSDIASLSKHVLAIWGDCNARDWFEEPNHLMGLQIDCVQRAAAVELRSNSFA
jgi:hypothetical protein